MNLAINIRLHYYLRRPSGVETARYLVKSKSATSGAAKVGVVYRLFSAEALINTFKSIKKLPTERGLLVVEPTYNRKFPQKDLQRNTNFPQTEKNLAEALMKLMAEKLGSSLKNLKAQVRIEADLQYGTIALKILDFRTNKLMRSYIEQSLGGPRGYQDFLLPEEPDWKEFYLNCAKDYLKIRGCSPEEYGQNSWGQFYYLQIYDPQKTLERALSKDTSSL